MTAGYLDIEDHGAIGNLETVVLVGRDGTIDWCCLPNLDSPSVFASLLDHQRGGLFRVRPSDAPHLGSQRYLDETNVLETTFATNGGQVSVTDFMAVAGPLDCPVETGADPTVFRLVTATTASTVEVTWAPRLNHAQAAMDITQHGDVVVASTASGGDGDQKAVVLLAGLDGRVDAIRIDDDHTGPVVRATLDMAAGDSRVLATRWGTAAPDVGEATTRDLLDETCQAWRRWVRSGSGATGRTWAEPHQDLVLRSELVLKLLTHARTGAIAAAATTSLPEDIGGVRNWDYRYAWIRDAALAAQALFALGHGAEVQAFLGWAERSAKEHQHDGVLRIMYRLDGGTDMPEADLPNLEGYRRSSPVRVGNGAADQLQLDIFGELVSLAWEVHRLGGTLDPDIRAFLPRVADESCTMWTRPDYGLWELRNGPFHFTYSKVMAWVALQRASELADEGVIEGDVANWRRHGADIRADVLSRGLDPNIGFTQSYERRSPDASNLLLGLHEFIPFDDDAMVATVTAVQEQLTEHGLVHRYSTDDGVAGGEGAFGLCTFWLVDALALSDRLDEATQVFEAMASRANHVGLFAEQIDPTSGAFLGNFPQAFTHLGLINSRLYLSHQMGREVPVRSLVGARNGDQPAGAGTEAGN
jgi:GH15 family glucan-1,4-alpha-glucosidase